VEPEIKRLEEKLTKEVLWLYVLSALLKKPLHAYALRREIHEKFGFLPGEVTAYVVLYKLEARGFVKAKQAENKKIYTVTESGKKLLKQAKKNIQEKQKILF